MWQPPVQLPFMLPGSHAAGRAGRWLNQQGNPPDNKSKVPDMQDLPDIDADLWKMISVAVETSVQSIQKQGKLLPFTLMRENGKWDMAMYMGDQAPKLVQKAQAAVGAKTGKIDM